MRFLVILVVLAVACLALSWSSGPPTLTAGASWRIGDPALAGRLTRRAADLAKSLGLTADVIGVRVRATELEAALLRTLTLQRATFLFALGSSAAILAGLAMRESARATLRFASPTWNYLGKRLSATALVAAVTVPLLPFEAPAWILYVAFLGCASGLTLYVANLPVKL